MPPAAHSGRWRSAADVVDAVGSGLSGRKDESSSGGLRAGVHRTSGSDRAAQQTAAKASRRWFRSPNGIGSGARSDRAKSAALAGHDVVDGDRAGMRHALQTSTTCAREKEILAGAVDAARRGRTRWVTSSRRNFQKLASCVNIATSTTTRSERSLLRSSRSLPLGWCGRSTGQTEAAMTAALCERSAPDPLIVGPRATISPASGTSLCRQVVAAGGPSVRSTQADQLLTRWHDAGSDSYGHRP